MSFCHKTIWLTFVADDERTKTDVIVF